MSWNYYYYYYWCGRTRRGKGSREWWRRMVMSRSFKWIIHVTVRRLLAAGRCLVCSSWHWTHCDIVYSTLSRSQWRFGVGFDARTVTLGILTLRLAVVVLRWLRIVSLLSIVIIYLVIIQIVLSVSWSKFFKVQLWGNSAETGARVCVIFVFCPYTDFLSIWRHSGVIQLFFGMPLCPLKEGMVLFAG